MALWDSGGGARPGARSCMAGHPRLVQPGLRLVSVRPGAPGPRQPTRDAPVTARAGDAWAECHTRLGGCVPSPQPPPSGGSVRSWGGQPSPPQPATVPRRGARASASKPDPPRCPPLTAPARAPCPVVWRRPAPAGSRHTCSGTEVCRGQQGPVPPRRLLSPSRSLPPPRPPARPAPSWACASWASARAPPAPAPRSAGPPQATVPTRCPSRLPSLSSQHVSLRW